MSAPALTTDIDRARLANGLQVVLHPRPGLPLVAVNLWYHVGSKNERPGRTGFAHLFEHMLFQGSQHVGDSHFRYVQQVGGVANGSTSRDRTNYYETLPARHLDLALWLESDRMGFLLPAMTDEKLETQRQVVMNERRQRVDNQPYGRAGERVFELLFPAGHPYGWPIIGYMDDIAGATLEEVRSFFATYYRPDNAVLTLAGDFEPDAALAAVERWFGPLEAGAEPRRVAAEARPLDGPRHEVLEDDVQLARVYLAFRAPAYGEAPWYAGDMLSSVLADGRSSPLYRDLVYSREIAQSVSCYIYDTELPGALFVVATARPGVEPESLEEAVLEHFGRIAREGPAPSDLERARHRTATHWHDQLQRLDRRADLLSQLATYFDDPGRLETELDRHLSVAAEEVASYAGSWCRPEQRAVVTVVSRRSRA